MSFDAMTVAGDVRDALRRRASHAAGVLAVLVLGLLFGPTAIAAAADAPAAANVHVSMIGAALRSSNLERSTRFYGQGLGMQLLRTIKMGTGTEVIMGFSGDLGQPVILLSKDDAPGQSPTIDHGDANSRIMLRVDDADALSARLTAAGYAPDEVHSDAVHQRKVFWVTDPDGYRYEITQTPPRP